VCDHGPASNLSRNSLTYLAFSLSTFAGLTSLSTLDLSNNPLDRIPVFHPDLTGSLAQLDLSNCGLHDVSSMFANVTGVSDLRLSGNPLRPDDFLFQTLPRLVRLELDDCGLQNIGNKLLHHLPKLEILCVPVCCIHPVCCHTPRRCLTE